ncbi:MAG: bifunctional phosphopantothenoylcysteine decarboxylase/phosphopantothenate--cysteine ligase CoaBC [Firmicutes bacterium]|nr:bifunctional phosphopantothenoylcysteine decarboxylase/phosphopantothenate--cysteine ligase CoaBC [Bacillota bacterium]MCM1400440.1 bifunctional phosphopantothenoylcysteine decarboxylase/phosphopantothenate--cysteine ligase CoaBC [Bacteroides sp.]MCM1476920.1 bifunctional phosphopantothenoylcysteine decarboxylase/phosphopantothenate--cysteine ligase CoaBC [Bacteroides sp.]
MLKGKHIIVGITGGIAAYKTATLVRLLIKQGAEVQVVMTPAAKQFITPVTMSALTGKPVVSEFFTANTGEWHSHVDLGLWADAMVIAPATASTIAKMANGVADNMLVTTYLSAKSTVFVAPAMDLDMMRHPSTVRNIELLRTYGNIIIEPTAGELASHLIGKGRMEEPENIVKVLDDFFAGAARLKGRRVLITAGPTYERIDPVRFIGNFSTGKMGYALADAAAAAGADVTVVSGPVSVAPANPSVKVVKVESAREMAEKCLELFPEVDTAIMCAAVADYAPVQVCDTKIKRENMEHVALELRRNPDIAASLGRIKRPGQTLVGFALETDHEEFNAQRKLASKNLDMIVLNSLAVPGAGFATDTNQVTVFKADGSAPVTIPLMSKVAVARKIINLL